MGRRKTKRSVRQVAPGLWEVYRYFWPEIRRYRWRVAGSLLAMLWAIVASLAEPWPLKLVLDRVIPVTSKTGRVPDQGWLASLPATQLLTLAAVSLIVIALVRAYAEYASRVGFFVVGNNVVLRMRDRVFRHLQRLSLGYHHRSRRGDLIIRVTRDVSLLRDVTGTAVLPLLASCLVLAGMLGVMFWLQWRLALLSLVTVPLFWASSLRLNRRIRDASRKQRAREGAMATIASESLQAIGVIKALGIENQFADTFAARNKKSQKEDLKASRLSVRLGCIIDVLLALSSAIVMWFGGRMTFQGHLSPGDLVVFLVYLKRSFKPAQQFAKYTSRLSKASASGERILELLQLQPEIEDRDGALEVTQVQGDVCLDTVTFSYSGGPRVLNRLSLRVSAGQCAAIVGPSGMGKSTLLSLMLRFYDPQEGRLLLDGRDLSDYRIASLRQQMSIVLQDCVLFASSVYDNIACGAEDVTPEKVESAARLACAHSFIEALPEGYDTVLGERGSTLSRGQRQRIAIARAAVRNAPLLLLDEPTTGLDEENERMVIEALIRLADHKTTLMVTHNLRLASFADQIYYLDRGRITEQGTHAELLERDGKYAALHRLQATTSSPQIIREVGHVLIP